MVYWEIKLNVFFWKWDFDISQYLLRRRNLVYIVFKYLAFQSFFLFSSILTFMYKNMQISACISKKQWSHCIALHLLSLWKVWLTYSSSALTSNKLTNNPNPSRGILLEKPVLHSANQQIFCPTWNSKAYHGFHRCRSRVLIPSQVNLITLQTVYS